MEKIVLDILLEHELTQPHGPKLYALDICLLVLERLRAEDQKTLDTILSSLYRLEQEGFIRYFDFNRKDVAEFRVELC